MNAITMIPTGPIDGTIRPPGSKSITNRALVCAALSHGRSTLSGVLDSDDTRVMVDCLRRLGVEIIWREEESVIRVVGRNGKLRGGEGELYVNNSGTTIRFLTAVVATGDGRYRLDGNERMRCRPIADLVDALRQLGIAAHCEQDNDCPPVVIETAGLPGGQVTVDGSISSQFASGLLLAAPCAQAPITIQLTGPVVSAPYIAMTESVMRKFGVSVIHQREGEFRMEPQSYCAADLAIEPDASAASYFWGAAAITQGEITVEGLTSASCQGDIGVLDVLARMGCSVQQTETGLRLRGAPLQGIDVDMGQMSDTVPTIAVVALFANGPTTIRGVAHIRHKESDRIGDLARELRKLGANVEERPDGLRIVPGPLQGAILETYDDHRLAMSLSLAGLKVPGITILDPDCTAKTYPTFFTDLRHVCQGSV